VAGCRSYVQLRRKIEKQDAERKNAQATDIALDYPTKKILFFCNGEVFSLDRGLLMGGISFNPVKLKDTDGSRNLRYAPNSDTVIRLVYPNTELFPSPFTMMM